MKSKGTAVERAHSGSGLFLYSFEASCVLIAIGLIVFHTYRIVQSPVLWSWSNLLAIAIAWPMADFVSGLVHWLADTWGSEEMPFLGPRFLRPFRVHHVTPKSFLECGFFDTNGDTSLIGIPILCTVFLFPLESSWGVWTSVLVVSFCAFALPTNQIHQWSHMPHPPRLVAILQRSGLILSPSNHRLHHSGSHTAHYCITTGWCNPILDSLGFFRLLERLVTKVTGLQPRADEDTHN